VNYQTFSYHSQTTFFTMYVHKIKRMSFNNMIAVRIMIEDYNLGETRDFKLAKVQHLDFLATSMPSFFRKDFKMNSIDVCPACIGDGGSYVGTRFMIKDGCDIADWLHPTIPANISVQVYANSDNGKCFVVHVEGDQETGKISKEALNFSLDLSWDMYSVLFDDQQVDMGVKNVAVLTADFIKASLNT
jgi:hypothetical protein